MSKILSLNVGSLIPACDSQSLLCPLSGTISKLQRFQDLPCAMAKEICVQQAGASRISLLRGWLHMLEFVYAATEPVMVKVTKTKYRVEQAGI